ncbi:DUF2608 domain-containing protein [Rickettsiaceae bacterium]|nr:DUF2608 domain-containing protein [Rickettsiaceae bacterium]
MGVRFLKTILISFLLVSDAYAKIIEATDSSQIRQYLDSLDKNDLVIFDIKEVIFAHNDYILSPNHRSKLQQFLKKIAKQKSKPEADRLYGIVLLNAELKIVDEGVPVIIKELLAKKVKVIGLTSERTGSFGSIAKIEEVILKQLKEYDIDFSKSFESSRAVLDEAKTINGTKFSPAMYKKGVLFTARRQKGEMLEALLKKLDFAPRRIIHIDSSIENISSISSFCEKAYIDYLGINFTKIYIGAERPLSKTISNKQLEVLAGRSRWASDEVAKCMFDTGLNIYECTH